MKKIIVSTIMLLLLIIPKSAYASGATVNIDVKGSVKKGESIDILVNVKDVEKFYAASVDFVYDTELLKIESISATDFITKYSSDIMEFGGETDKNGNTASYSFTFLGEKDGISGTGSMVSIKATVISDGKLSISEDNMNIKLVQRSGDSVENYPYTFVGYTVEDNNQVEQSKPEDNSSEEENTNLNQVNNPDNTVNKDISNDETDKSNSVSENKNETIESQQDIDEEEVSDSKDISETSIDNKDETNSDKAAIQASENKSKNTNAVYVGIGLVVLSGVGFVGYKIYKDKSKK